MPTKLLPEFPLTSHAPDSIIAWSRHGTISTRQFITEAYALSALLPPGQHILNLCKNRYHFMVGLAASLISHKISLLPSNHTAESIRQMREIAADLFCLTDDEPPDGLPTLSYPTRHLSRLPHGDDKQTFNIPAFAGESIVAKIFTSGSTGIPVPHNKNWQSLVLSARSAANRLAISASYGIVGTVPPQHMYGLESIILLAWHGNCHLWMENSFYPADIVDAVKQSPSPALLVTTPFHLKTLLDSITEPINIQRVLCATAPLDIHLATRAEHILGTQLHEIYGCTETGQLATRRTTQTTDWQLFDGIQLYQHSPTDQKQDAHEQTVAIGGHLPTAIALPDRLDILPNGFFRLHGRHHDLINIAGKRHSLSALTSQLLSIPQVIDGCFFLPDDTPPHTLTRLCAVVVAPALTHAAILHALRLRLDPAFLPRPIILIDRLPRNATGKLPQQALMTLLEQYRANQNEPASQLRDELSTKQTAIQDAMTTLTVPDDHPALAGHFPGNPILPGVVLLDYLQQWLITCQPHAIHQFQLISVKFLRPVTPGERLTLSLHTGDRQRYRLQAQTDGQLVAQADFQLMQQTMNTMNIAYANET